MEVISTYHIRTEATKASFVAVLFLAPLLWMLMDRTPPYVREDGQIIPDMPAPGDTVEVKWRTRVIRNCPPNTPRNVTFSIIDRSGKRHEFEPVLGIYGTTKEAPPNITRTFRLPGTIDPGPATYRSAACFACNPIHYLAPVCVTEPDIVFEIGAPK